jgi:hypothetical protein
LAFLRVLAAVIFFQQFSDLGMMALPRTPMDTISSDTETEKGPEDIVDVSSLPPG